MEDLQAVDTRQLYLSRHCHQSEDAEFTLLLPEELVVSTSKRYFLDIRRCVLPRVRVKVPANQLRLNDGVELDIPQLDVTRVREVVDAINERLTKDFTPLEFLPADRDRPRPCLRVTLLPGQNIRVSPYLGDLLFEGRTNVRNDLLIKTSKFTFKIGKHIQANTYYLICDALENVPVGNSQLPLVNSLSVNYLEDENHTNLTWDTHHTLEKSYFRAGVFRQLRLRFCDGQGRTLKLNGGVLFLHLKLCT